jgi:hypothetical protein
MMIWAMLTACGNVQTQDIHAVILPAIASRIKH